MEENKKELHLMEIYIINNMPTDFDHFWYLIKNILSILLIVLKKIGIDYEFITNLSLNYKFLIYFFIIRYEIG